MDEVRIVTAGTKKIIGVLIERAIKKHYGYKVHVRPDDCNLTIMPDGEMSVHISLDAVIGKEEFNALIMDKVLGKGE